MRKYAKLPATYRSLFALSQHCRSVTGSQPTPPQPQAAPYVAAPSSHASTGVHLSWRESVFSSWQNGLVTGLGGCCAVGALAFVLWKPFREDSVHQTAVVASEALSDFKVKEQAVILSKEVVENVLRDPKSVELVVRVVAQLLQNEDTRVAVTSFIKSIFEDHFTKEITKKFVVDIIDSKLVREQLDVVAYDLLMVLLKNPSVKAALSQYLLEATSDALRDPRLHANTAQAVRSMAYYTVVPWAPSPSDD